MKRALAITAVAAACALTTLAALSGSARATYPGATNGRLAFAIKDGSGVSNIYSVKPDGDGLVRLTNTTAFDLCPDYSRDGRLITFCSNRSGSFQIWAMNADGSNAHMVTNGNRFIFPDYSPDASKIVFSGTASATDVNQNVYVINADGTGLKQLTTDREQHLRDLLARRQEDRVHQRPHRRRAGVGDERRRVEADPALAQRRQGGPGTGLEPRREEDRVRAG